jgi:hypothetical protein
MTSKAQVLANQQNAQKSTGPKSLDGKQKVGSNRITHGILSTKLLLAGESSQDYQSLLNDLQAQLRPVGVLELTLVEKVAVILWRQRRLVGAETAVIELEMTPQRVASEVNAGMDLTGFIGDKIEPEDLQPFTQEQSELLDQCRAMISEYDDSDSLTLRNLSKAAPFIYEQLSQDAEADNETVKEHLAETGLEGYIQDLMNWCHVQVHKLETQEARQPTVLKLAAQAKDKLAIPWQRLGVLTKYQTTLDNQLYKAIKALRDEQAWRLDNLDAIDETPPLAIGFE